MAKYNPELSVQEVYDLLNRTADQERELVLKHGLNLDQAREIVREELFPPKAEIPPRIRSAPGLHVSGSRATSPPSATT